jgi:cephalosporin-C deacetylase-like acetyl esterase
MMKPTGSYLHIFLFLVILSFPTRNLFAQQENLDVLNRWIEWSDGGSMLIRHLNRQAFAYLDARDIDVARLTTRADWERRQQHVRNTLMDIVGPFPAKTSLNSRVTGILKKEGYSIEKVIYESMPGFPVTGCLYIPDGDRGRKPAILYVSGHYQNSFRNEQYQVMILNLVKKGFIVFAIDPVSQGERIQVFNPETNESLIGPTTMEHSYLGHQCFITGSSLAKYFIWDGIRAIDYMLTRKEVDPARLGITGHSGGGTQTSCIFAFDDRIKAAASVNYITGFRRLLESIGPQDAEQNFYRGIISGITHADLLAVRAPAPSLILAGTYDFFSIQGARETYDEVKRTYAAYGKEASLALVEDDWGHGYTRKLRESVYAFFQENLNMPGDPSDLEVTILKQEELMITPTGHVATSVENAETVFSLNRKRAEELIKNLNQSRENQEQHIAKILSEARDLSGYIAPSSNTRPVFRGRYQRDGYAVEMYALQGEGEYVVPLLVFVPHEIIKAPAVIYLHPEGKIADAARGGKIEQLVKKGYIVAAPDVIGTGEVYCNGVARNNFLAVMIGRSITGIQAGDVSRVVNFLKDRPDVDPGRIGAVALNQMGPVLLHAAAFDNSISSVTLAGSLVSYQGIVNNKVYDSGFMNYYVAGALTLYDLPDLAGLIAPRKVAFVGLNDHLNQPLSSERLNTGLAFPRSVYSGKNVPDNIVISDNPDNLVSIIAWSLR